MLVGFTPGLGKKEAIWVAEQALSLAQLRSSGT
jgi:hypothetical protein